MTRPRAICLISGGLDSMLAAKVVAEQGVDVEGVNFFTGFCVEGHTQAIRSSQSDKVKRHGALWVAEQIGIKIHIEDIVEDYKDVVLNPKHGYGKLLNPCLDCKIFMVNRAMEMKSSDGYPYDFVVTGEVIGQRPKSQRSNTMSIVAKESGVEDRLLRPLCAKHLPPTLPERKGWVDRDELFDFSGRTRKPQFELARKFGITEWSQPAGGCCFLTDESYSNRLNDLWQSRKVRDYEFEDIVLLKVGRHIRPTEEFKVIIARDEGESNYLQGFKKQFKTIQLVSHTGPVSLFDGIASESNLHLASQIIARYSKGRNADNVLVSITDESGVSRDLTIEPLPAHEIEQNWHIGI
ncbi:MAG: tRNA (5-methylaminomethyl-2-thiouridylate)-methyltransferase [Gammaproteobacteria bacterium]|nr:tRNA (5-methylaminomethyl-2-thiouridylate)-methyltransferase [Gammaproteobacteria bacterium]